MAMQWVPGSPGDGYYWDPEQFKIDPVKDAESRALAERRKAEIDAAIAKRAYARPR